MRRLIGSAVVCVLLAAVAGSSPAPHGPQAVLAVQTDVTTWVPGHTDEVLDIGLPHLHNLTDQTVRLRSVQWVNRPAAAHIISVYAYRYADIGHGVIGLEGNLPIACPDRYKPAPVTAAITAPHRDSQWFVVITFTINQPGVYHFDQAKIRYLTGGHRGWQYQNLATTSKIADPPLPGPVPIPRSGICE